MEINPEILTSRGAFKRFKSRIKVWVIGQDHGLLEWTDKFQLPARSEHPSNAGVMISVRIDLGQTLI
ncbi:unnamed protein product [Phytophthora fragariaefolia]|uniref:Unnamed protein product n=1 Tax=Phytophthora fragariaefolia TaxID=1490495 RepID=A0A9W6YCG1_9STRA|nr:unnamed protein product [Phytophthora fragariaefolia]